MKKVFVFLLFMILILADSFAEGTKQLRPVSGDFGYLQINDKGRTFATYVAAKDERIYIHISNNREKIYFGIGRITGYNNGSFTDVWYRIKDPAGNIVFGPKQVTTSGSGWIANYNQAVAGPNVLNGSGYNAMGFTPSGTGDYYIEFNRGHATNSTAPDATQANTRMFENIDITVIDTVSMTARPGRVWSKNWDITTLDVNREFKGTFYVYSNDGVVTSINFNGIKPYAFRVACNSTGCDSTGNPVLDRQSRAGNHTYSSYKIFLNDPDLNAYPDGVIGSLQTSIQLSGCAPNYCINLDTDAGGYVEFIINLNGVPGYQIGSRDLVFAQNVDPGLTCIPWNGRDGLGDIVNQDIAFEITAEYKFGLTNLPLYDAENFSGGLIVSSVRPLAAIKPSLFWDDSNIPGGSINLTGCTSTACHSWPSSEFGDDRTINTWWYVNVEKDTIYTISIPKPTPVASGSATSTCDTSETLSFSTPLVPGNSYEWFIKRGSIISGVLTHEVEIRPVYGKDTLIVKETNSVGCYEDTVFISAYPVPSPDISGDSITCDVNVTELYNTAPVNGNVYLWSVDGGNINTGQGTGTLSVTWTISGNGRITLKETNPLGCEQTVIKDVEVNYRPSPTIVH